MAFNLDEFSEDDIIDEEDELDDFDADEEENAEDDADFFDDADDALDAEFTDGEDSNIVDAEIENDEEIDSVVNEIPPPDFWDTEYEA